MAKSFLQRAGRGEGVRGISDQTRLKTVVDKISFTKSESRAFILQPFS
jgi:hypothetical protein